MFDIKKERNEKYTQYRLIDEKENMEAVVCPENGGMLISLIKDGYEYIKLDEDNFYHGEKPSTANPILFPINGKLKDNIFTYKDKKYEIPSHGLARRMDWKLKDMSKDDGARITISINSNEYTRKHYPFEFEFNLTYVLKDGKIRLIQEYINKGSEDMLYTFGFHPYFNISSIKNALVKLDASKISFMENLDFSDFKDKSYKLRDDVLEDEVMFLDPKNPVDLFDEGNSKSIRIAFDSNFKVLILWSKIKENFICVEPWNSLPNALNEEGFEILKANEKKLAEISFEILK